MGKKYNPTMYMCVYVYVNVYVYMYIYINIYINIYICTHACMYSGDGGGAHPAVLRDFSSLCPM